MTKEEIPYGRWVTTSQFLSPTIILWKRRKKRIFTKKEAEKRTFWKKRGKGGKRGGVGCQVLVVHSCNGSIIRNRFEVFTNNFNKELHACTSYEKLMYLFPSPRTNDIKFFRLILRNIFAQVSVYTTGT